ncbi:hypothetical protein Agabi119p4_2502 [Agaricus bisporus var. burnettii]|uniref:Transcriptional coactivator p15 (PC4) C-terminal domain-containing protein n=1 Tax=Agaricus bisporus var. burnettii TaxID=192524 RepID=A0A8H7F953_AGABI|nr:hypothetical protein Agabi119p4_2502 [Agaricus bisporus var. burnettii]
MTKRKVQPSSESESEAQLSTDSEPKSRPPAKKKATAKKAEADTGVGSSVEDKAKNKKATSSASVHKSVEGDKYIDLGKKKRATVRSFKDIPLLDIREFYGTGSEEKPGKKGISLTLEHWQVLKENSDTIDELFSDLSKGKK